MEQILKGKCLYTPKGAAREYATVGCNFYRGCPYQCKYCYNRKGLTANVLGIPHAVLNKKFAHPRQEDAWLFPSPEEYAFFLFNDEIEKYQDYLCRTGIFFSFTTDPLCQDCESLTILATLLAVSNDIPVKILTKNVTWADDETLELLSSLEDKKHLIAFGFTLTGRDDEEPFASSNKERIKLMMKLHTMGFHTFASIEPIVDFPSSWKMIEYTHGFCDQYLIGLMSKRGKDYPPYDPADCAAFVRDVNVLLLLCPQAFGDAKVYWKESVRKFMAADDETMSIITQSPASVGRDWSLFTKQNIEL